MRKLQGEKDELSGENSNLLEQVKLYKVLIVLFLFVHNTYSRHTMQMSITLIVDTQYRCP